MYLYKVRNPGGIEPPSSQCTLWVIERSAISELMDPSIYHNRTQTKLNQFTLFKLRDSEMTPNADKTFGLISPHRIL